MPNGALTTPTNFTLVEMMEVLNQQRNAPSAYSDTFLHDIFFAVVAPVTICYIVMKNWVIKAIRSVEQFLISWSLFCCSPSSFHDSVSAGPTLYSLSPYHRPCLFTISFFSCKRKSEFSLFGTSFQWDQTSQNNPVRRAKELKFWASFQCFAKPWMLITFSVLPRKLFGLCRMASQSKYAFSPDEDKFAENITHIMWRSTSSRNWE